MRLDAVYCQKSLWFSLRWAHRRWCRRNQVAVERIISAYVDTQLLFKL